jgi:predicted DNA binding CopG/RHH family protein
MKRTNRITILVTDKELKELQDKASDLGLTLSAFIRFLALEKNKVS